MAQTIDPLLDGMDVLELGAGDGPNRGQLMVEDQNARIVALDRGVDPVTDTRESGQASVTGLSQDVRQVNQLLFRPARHPERIGDCVRGGVADRGQQGHTIRQVHRWPRSPVSRKFRTCTYAQSGWSRQFGAEKQSRQAPQIVRRLSLPEEGELLGSAAADETEAGQSNSKHCQARGFRRENLCLEGTRPYASKTAVHRVVPERGGRGEIILPGCADAVARSRNSRYRIPALRRWWSM